VASKELQVNTIEEEPATEQTNNPRERAKEGKAMINLNLFKNKRKRKADLKKHLRDNTSLQRTAIKKAYRAAPFVKRYERGEMPSIMTEKSQSGVYQLVLKRVTGPDTSEALEKIKQKRRSQHIAFPKFQRSIGQTHIEAFTKYPTTLYTELKKSRGTGFPIWRTAKILFGILDAISSFHEAGYIHGDVKPDNIAMTYGKVKLIDFGHTSSISIKKMESTANKYYSRKGSWESPSTDLWAIGCIFIEMLLGRKMRLNDNDSDEAIAVNSKSEIIEKYPENSQVIIDLIAELLADIPKKAVELLQHTFFNSRNEHSNDIERVDKWRREGKEKANKIKKKRQSMWGGTLS
jgi:serine/threonine protein kinase